MEYQMRITAIMPQDLSEAGHFDHPLVQTEHCLSTASAYRKAGYRFILLQLGEITWEYYRRPPPLTPSE